MKLAEKMAAAIMYMKEVQYYQGRDWISPTEIGGLFGGHSSIGSPLCKKMVEHGLAERNEKGHYKLTLTSNEQER